MAYTLTARERKAWTRLAGGRAFPVELEFADEADKRLGQLALCKVAIEAGFPARGIEQEHLDDEDGPEMLLARVTEYREGRI